MNGPVAGNAAAPSYAGLAGASSVASAVSADVSAAWARLDRSAQMLAGASLAGFAITLVGLPLSVWDSAQLRCWCSRPPS